jgi:hypothetical protein
MIKIFFLIALIPFFHSAAIAQGGHVIPFRLTEHNNISVKAVLNKTDTLDLIVHSAANSLTITEEAVRKLKSVRFSAKIDGVESWGSETNSARVSVNNSLQMGALDWKNVSIRENINSGPSTDGKFGIDFFTDWWIEIDFDHLVIRLGKKQPKGLRKYEKVKLDFQDGDLFVEAELKTKKGVVKNRFLLHSGYSGALLLDDKFALESNMNSTLQIVSEQKLTDSYGNVLLSKQAILPELNIAGMSLTNVPTGFFDGAIGQQQISILGGDVLKRFNLIIDAKREYIYLKPSQWMKMKSTAEEMERK